MKTTKEYGETRCVGEEFIENLVDNSALASSSREISSEPRGKVLSGKHSI